MPDPPAPHTPGGHQSNGAWPHRYILVVLTGIGLLALAQLFLLLTTISAMQGNVAIAALFATLGTLGIGIGFAVAGALGRALHPGARIAFLVAGAYFTTLAGPINLLTQTGSLF